MTIRKGRPAPTVTSSKPPRSNLMAWHPYKASTASGVEAPARIQGAPACRTGRVSPEDSGGESGTPGAGAANSAAHLAGRRDPSQHWWRLRPEWPVIVLAY